MNNIDFQKIINECQFNHLKIITEDIGGSSMEPSVPMEFLVNTSDEFEHTRMSLSVLHEICEKYYKIKSGETK